MKPPNLSEQQTALRDLATSQLATAQETLQSLLDVTSKQGDREAIDDAIGSTASAQSLLADWFGVEFEAGELE